MALWTELARGFVAQKGLEVVQAAATQVLRIGSVIVVPLLVTVT